MKEWSKERLTQHKVSNARWGLHALITGDWLDASHYAKHSNIKATPEVVEILGKIKDELNEAIGLLVEIQEDKDHVKDENNRLLEQIASEHKDKDESVEDCECKHCRRRAELERGGDFD